MTGAPQPGDDDRPLRDAVGRKGSFLRSLQAVAWSFFGVRRSAEHEKDLNQLNPVHVIVAGLVAAAVFIGVLVAVVRWVVSSPAAAS